MTKDENFMQKALELARLGEGYVNPNPMVGAVLVKNGRIISTGYHKKYGLGMQKEWLLKIVKLL